MYILSDFNDTVDYQVDDYQVESIKMSYESIGNEIVEISYKIIQYEKIVNFTECKCKRNEYSSKINELELELVELRTELASLETLMNQTTKT